MYNFSGYFEAIILEDSHIRQKYFKVRIPSLFPESSEEDKLTPNENILQRSGKERIVNSNIKEVIGGSYKTTNFALARNHTGLHYKLKGDVFKKRMDGTDGITEPKAGGSGDAEYESHEHEIKKPMSLYNFVFENLNNVMVKKNTKCYGFFINGAADMTRFAVTFIEGAVPLEDSDPIAYQK